MSRPDKVDNLDMGYITDGRLDNYWGLEFGTMEKVIDLYRKLPLVILGMSGDSI